MLQARSGHGAASRGVGSCRVPVAASWRRCPSSSLSVLAQRQPHQLQMLPVGPGPMGAGGAHNLHLEISLADLTLRQQERVLQHITAVDHPLGLYSLLSKGAGHWVNPGREKAAFQFMLPDLGPGMPVAMHAAHLDVAASMEQLVREGLKVALPGGEERWLTARYRQLACAPGQVVLKLKGMPPEYAQVGVASTLLLCAGYTPEQAPVVREFMAPFPWSPPAAPVGNSGVLLAYVSYPEGDPCLRQLPTSFRLSPVCEVSVEVDTRGVNPVVPPPPPGRPSQQPPGGLGHAAERAALGGPGEGGRGMETDPAAAGGGGGAPMPPPPPLAHGAPLPPEQAAAQQQPPRQLDEQGQPRGSAIGQPSAAGGAGGRYTALAGAGPEVIMEPADGQGGLMAQGGAGGAPGGAAGWQVPRGSHPWQQPRGPQHPPAGAGGSGGGLRPPDHPAVVATATGLPPLVEAELATAYEEWRATPAGSSWDATIRDWLGEEGLDEEAREGAMLRFYDEHAPRLKGPRGPNRAGDLPRWVMQWACREGYVASYGSDISVAGSSRAASEDGSHGREGGNSAGVGRRASARVRRPAPLACDLPAPLTASHPRPRSGGGGGRP